MKKPFVFMIAVAALVIAAAVVFMLPDVRRKAPARVLTTTVKVFEGVVDVYRLEDGKKNFRGPVRAGEELVVQTEIAGGKDTKALGLLASAVPVVASVLQKQADAVAARMTDGQYAGTLSEEAVNRSLAEHLAGSGVSSPVCVITSAGVRANAVLGKGFLKAKVSAEGKLKPSEEGRLDLALTGVKIGVLQLPDWALRQLEDVFEAAMAKADLAIEVLELEYEDGGVLVYARRRGG